MRAIKGLVIGMGVLILAGFVVVAVTLAVRTKGNDPNGAPFQNVVQLPAGGKIVETTFGDDKIILRIRMQNGGDALVLIDARDGRERGRIALPGSQ
jgi:hypothetical protein